jgi:arsenate reductase (thioredoxin)
MSDRTRVLILCTGNSARSQMAEGLLRHDAGHRFEVHSAGTDPTQVNPLAIEAMREIGVDISGQWSKSVEEFVGQEFDYVITVCDRANESCPAFAETTRRIHWGFPDPADATGSDEERLQAFRDVRDRLRQRLASFSTAPLLAIGADRA